MEIPTVKHPNSPVTAKTSHDAPYLATRSAARYERKFVAEGVERTAIEARIRLNPGLFRPIHAGRFINNLYLDDPGRSSYRQTVEGVADRLKVRIRWYGQAAGVIVSPQLEFKIKRGLVGHKETYPLPGFVMDKAFTARTLQTLFAELPGRIRERLSWLEPALINRYYRTYFGSMDGRFRITVDTGLLYGGASTRGIEPAYRFIEDRRVIIELKYGVPDADDAARIAGAFPFRVARFSKYAVGVERVGLGGSQGG